MTNPTRQEIIDAHEELKKLCQRLPATRAAKETILRALPPLPRPTMADIEWVVSELLFAEVENIESGELGILLAYDVMPDGEKFMYVNHFDGDIHRYSPGMLTLTGEKYTLEKETPND
ncbi:hypothetical protein GWO56_08030 [Corynebacterium macginleyi]|uniref:hypothetical protein n=1 Tax=Corynebacterium macginleyi TaxID=38290 RepID=UPI00190A2ABF|nr:hypothetical protein [Corynebacterium macginleyi]MBK4159478.1 hypothetical protein [Corynebacterium macginleyi]